MNFSGKYNRLYFEIELDKKKILLRRVLEDNKLRWEYFTDNRWTLCDESSREELKPSILESNYKNYMRTLKLERILID